MIKYLNTNYLIGKNGEVMNASSKKLIKPQNNGNGYLKVTLSIDKIQVQRYVHRLVAEIYCKNELHLKQVNHIDGNKSNNHFSNLEWCSNRENQIHAHKIGLKKNGNQLWNGKFSKEDIKIIFDMKKGGVLQYIIASQFRVSKGTISEILNGKRYKYI
jgi:hypothetical protein